MQNQHPHNDSTRVVIKTPLSPYMWLIISLSSTLFVSEAYSALPMHLPSAGSWLTSEVFTVNKFFLDISFGESIWSYRYPCVQAYWHFLALVTTRETWKPPVLFVDTQSTNDHRVDLKKKGTHVQKVWQLSIRWITLTR